MKKEKIKTIAIIILAVIILASASLVGVSKYSQTQQIKGSQIGYEQCIVDVMNQVTTCQPVPLTFNNQTINIIAIECLQNG